MMASKLFQVKQSKGFSLIEVIVTITIITILASISFASYSSVQQSARDTKRQSDLKTIQSALEHYHADQNNFPVTLNLNSSLTNPGGSVIYLNKIPSDPLSTPPYGYASYPSGCDNSQSSSFCSGYCLYAKMEKSTNSRPTFCLPAQSYDSQYNYTVTPL